MAIIADIATIIWVFIWCVRLHFPRKNMKIFLLF
ncbi:hypothetical protein U370_02395 [Anaplasma marginale str. Dawn]|nr:hypothetical protein U370_02395 [Anaplasma marginale str. Dawn]